MTPTDSAAKLNAGYTPRLLTFQEAVMSEGPWEICPTEEPTERFRGGIFDKTGFFHIATAHCQSGSLTQTTIEDEERLANARYIAAASGWAELLWKQFQILKPLRMEALVNQWGNALKEYHEAMLEILIALSYAGRLGWDEPRKGGSTK